MSQPGRLNHPDFCIQSCQERCLPAGVINAIWQGDQSNVHKGEMVTVTSLARCPRKFKLMRSEDYAEEPQSLYAAIRGVISHGMIENAADTIPNVQVEQRIFKTIKIGTQEPWVISGQIDYYNQTEQKLEDFKSASDKIFWVMFNQGVKEDHVLQLSIYAWLMDGGNLGSADGPVIHWPVKEAVIHTLTMNKTFTTGQRFTHVFQEHKEPNYGRKYKLEVPGTRKQTGKTKRGVPIWEITFDNPAIQLLPFDIVEDYVLDKGRKLVRSFRDPDWMPTGILHDDDANWECSYCPVKSRCDTIEEAAAVIHYLKEDSEIPLF